MVDGAIAKFRKENALLSQLFVIDGKTPVAEVVAAAGKDVGADVTLKRFVRFQLGEGLEQEESDFAAEVAAVPAAEWIAGLPPPVRGRPLGNGGHSDYGARH